MTKRLIGFIQSMALVLGGLFGAPPPARRRSKSASPSLFRWQSWFAPRSGHLVYALGNGDQVSSATITALQGVAGAPCAGLGVLGVDVSGTFVATLQFEGTIDGANYFAVNAYPNLTPGVVQSTAATGRWFVPCAGLNAVRVRCSAFTSGSALVVFEGSAGAPIRDMAKSAQTVLATGARTTTQTSADIPTGGAKRLTAILDMTTVGTASVTITINGKDPASGKYYLLLGGAAVTTNSTNVYHAGAGLPVTTNVSANVPIPDIIQIVVTANNANSGTYSVGLELMP